MKPYLAIIKDSFREAMASKVLWIILVICTLFLGGLIPLSVMDEYPSTCEPAGVKNPIEFAKQLQAATDPVDKAVTGLLSKEFMEAIEADDLDAAMKENPELTRFTVRMVIAKEVNALLQRSDLYNAELMKSRLTSDTKRLLGDGVNSLDAEKLPQFNRRLLADLYPNNLPLPEGKMCKISYAGLDFPSLPYGKTEAMDWVLKTSLGFTIGLFGVFVPLLFTANMIPRTFEAGSIDMLLSKPVYRSWVFLAKYAGGCSFVTIIAAFVITGIYVIFGLRLGYWHWRLFLCIPVFVFNYGVYYSVSAIAGLVWRNAIAAIIISLVFMFTCFSVGKTKTTMYEWVYMHAMPTGMVLADDVMTVDAVGQVRRWDKIEHKWVACFTERGGAMEMAQQQMSGNRFVGPIYDEKNQRLLAFDSYRPVLLTASKMTEWQKENSIAMPAGSSNLLTFKGEDIITVTGTGVHRLSHNGGTDSFSPISQEYNCGFYIYAAIHPVSGDIAVSGKRQIVWLKRLNNGIYKVHAKVEGQSENRLLLAFLGTDLLAADSTGKVFTYDSDLKPKGSVTPLKGEVPKTFAVASDGRTAFLLFHNKKLMMVKNDDRTFRRASVHNQGEITGVSILNNGQLAVGGDINRVYVYDTATLKKANYYKPKMDKVEMFYRFGIVPIYTLFPNPGQISNLSSYIVTGEKSYQSGKDLTQFRQRMELWKPVWSCLIFIAVILGYGCFHVARRDF